MVSYGGSAGKEPACSAGDPGSIPGSGRAPGGGHGSPLQYSALENPTDGGAWRAAAHGVVSVGMVTKTHCAAELTGFPGGGEVKNLPVNAGDVGSIPGLGRSPGVGSGHPLQYSCLENLRDRGA